jgi:hypothetical protein
MSMSGPVGLGILHENGHARKGANPKSNPKHRIQTLQLFYRRIPITLAQPATIDIPRV